MSPPPHLVERGQLSPDRPQLGAQSDAHQHDRHAKHHLHRGERVAIVSHHKHYTQGGKQVWRLLHDVLSLTRMMPMTRCRMEK